MKTINIIIDIIIILLVMGLLLYSCNMAYGFILNSCY
jgi:predicted small secreted protein